MLVKYFKLTVLLVVYLSCLIVTNGNAADKLYYGSYDGEEYASVLKDSLKFNIVRSDRSDFSEIQLLAENAMRAIVANFGDSTPLSWSGKSHYTLWEAEGYPGSNVNLQYDGGSLVDDDFASGGEAMEFSGPDTPRIIQTGPGYYQYGTRQYTAEFCLKYLSDTLLGTVALSSSTPVCSIMVVDRDTIILKDTTIYKDDFGIEGSYKTFKLENYTVQDDPWTGIEFKIYWFGIPGDFYIDYVKVYNENGLLVMSGAKDSAITAYVSQDWTKTVNTEGDTVIYRWYLKDEPLSIDLYMPTAHIDSLLKEVSQERVGFQAYCWYRSTLQVHEYLLRQNPTDFCVDIYPMRWLEQETTGTDYQNVWTDEYTDRLNFVKTQADSLNKDFWLVTQAGVSTNRDTANCPFDLIFWNDSCYCPGQREPSRYEMRLQTFLGLCYGADGVLYFRYQWWIDGNQNLFTGLYDPLYDSTTYKWQEIRDFIGPRMKVLGPIYAPLEWQGACLDDEVGGVLLRNGQSSYIDSIRSHNPADEPHWVQVGFFEDQAGDTSYFMLVNRECLETEGANYDVFLSKVGGPFYVRDVYLDSTIAIVNGIGDMFVVYLGPGEGKLFRLEPFTPSPHVIRIPVDYPTIQEGIDAASYGDTVLVATGTYVENINFLGKAITVASHFIYDHNSATIEATIIDGSSPWNPDSASVVTFVSGEGSNSILKGFTITGGTGTSQLGPGRPEHRGGGIFCSYSSPTIINNLIIDNYIPDHGSDFDWGGGIGCLVSSPTIANNLILNNSVLGYDVGGGICLKSGGSPLIVNNTISDNVRGGIYVWNVSDPFVITNNIITNNTDFGIWANYNSYGISYNDVWNNDGYNFVYCPPEIGDTTWGTNRNGTPCDSFYNIIRDPMFVIPGTDYHLQESSPCINAGDNYAPGLQDFDFDGNPRIRGGYVDMGAYEYQTPFEVPSLSKLGLLVLFLLLMGTAVWMIKRKRLAV